MADDERRRRRMRSASGTPERGDRAPRAPAARGRQARDDEPPLAPSADPPFGASSGAGDDRDERSLRGLIGGGSSQINVRAAMRARDASRPSDAELAAVAATLTIVRRGWTPRDP